MYNVVYGMGLNIVTLVQFNQNILNDECMAQLSLGTLLKAKFMSVLGDIALKTPSFAFRYLYWVKVGAVSR